MKSILKTYSAGSISNLTLIGMLSVLVSACGSQDSTNPRAYDTTGPEIIMAGDAIVELDIGDEYVEMGATARDVWDGNTIVDQDPSTAGIQGVATEGVDSIDTTVVDTYEVTYTAEDSSGNVSTAVRTINVADRTGPVISITGDNPVLVAFGDDFDLPSASSFDAFDNATTTVTDITSNVDTTTIGTYTVTFAASDASGNETTKALTVIVEPSYQDEIVLFSNGSLAEGWVLNGYDVDLDYGACPGNTCPNLDYGIENDPTKERDVIYIDQGIDNTNQAGFFMQVGDPDKEDDDLANDPIDLRGAEVNGKLTFEVWSDSADGVDLNIAVDCPAYPNAANPVLLEGVGAQQWQEISIPAADLFNQGCALRSDQIGTIPMFLANWIGPKIRIDNIVWQCEFSCDGSDIPDQEYTPWVKVEKTKGYDTTGTYAGYDLIWSDEFDGTEVDQTKWNLDSGCAQAGCGNSELQYYRPENAAVEDGLLVITADIQQSDDADLPGGESFSSAKLTTQDLFEFKHGRVDIRAAVAEGKGMWSAGWMLGANVDEIGWPFSGEIDIVETIGGNTYGVSQEERMVHNAYWNGDGPFAEGQSLNPRQYDLSTYSPTPNGQNIAWGERVLDDGNTFSDTFHVFSIEWDETKIRYMIDGVHQPGRDLDLTTTGPIGPCIEGQVPNEPQLSCVGQSFNNDFFLILNVAVGGTFPGAPDETSQFPRGMLVDYVRVYQTSAQQDAQD